MSVPPGSFCFDCYTRGLHQSWCRTLQNSDVYLSEFLQGLPIATPSSRVTDSAPDSTVKQLDAFEADMRGVINRNNLGRLCDTPDHILARYLRGCLAQYASTTAARDHWSRKD